MTNQKFCYWLQGFFEISRSCLLTRDKILLIQGSLSQINEPLGHFTKWLSEVIIFFEAQNFNQSLIDYFLLEIRDRLNMIFFHVIDQSYDTHLNIETRKKIHDGHAT